MHLTKSDNIKSFFFVFVGIALGVGYFLRLKSCSLLTKITTHPDSTKYRLRAAANSICTTHG